MRPQRYLYLLAVFTTVLTLAACAGPEPEILDRGISEWTVQLDSEDRHDRLAAIRAVGEIARRNPEDSRPTAALRSAFTHEDDAVRHWAVRSAGSMDDRGSAFEQDLRTRLSDDEVHVRVWAAQALCRLGRQEEALPILADALSDTNGGTRLHAAHALESLGEDARPVVEALRGVLGDGFGYPDRVAGRVLKNLGEYPENTLPN